MKSSWFKKKPPLTPEQVGEVISAVRNMKQAVNILLANKSPTLKRQLGLQGAYSKHRDNAAKVVLDDTFHLAIAIILIRNKKNLSRWFLDAEEQVNLFATATLGEDGKIVMPSDSPGTLSPAPPEESDKDVITGASLDNGKA